MKKETTANKLANAVRQAKQDNSPTTPAEAEPTAPPTTAVETKTEEPAFYFLSSRRVWPD